MPGVQISYVLLGCLAIALLYAAFTDFRRREIDNWLTLGIALSAPLFWWASGLTLWPDVAWQVGLALITFCAAAGLFALGGMGGGDVKLIAALALWIAPMPFMRLLIVMSIVGGVLSLLILILRKVRRNPERGQVPYGLAISAAGLWTLGSQHLGMLPGAAT